MFFTRSSLRYTTLLSNVGIIFLYFLLFSTLLPQHAQAAAISREKRAATVATTDETITIVTETQTTRHNTESDPDIVRQQPVGKEGAPKIESENVSITPTITTKLHLQRIESEQPVSAQSSVSPIFSHDTVTIKPTENMTTILHVSNGLDSMMQEDEPALSKKQWTTTTANTATTENILPELEQTAVKMRNQSDVTGNSFGFDTSFPTGKAFIDFNADNNARSMLHSEELSKAEITAEKSTLRATPNLSYFDKSTAAASQAALSEVQLESTTLSNLLMSSGAADSDNSNTNYTVLPKYNTVQDASNEIRAEKRPKFINDNSTNAQQMKLPDAAEVWSLAGMKMPPPTTAAAANVTHMEMATEQTSVAAVFISPTTEKPINNSLITSGNSEKNLLDWSQIMMHSELTSSTTESLPPLKSHDDRTEMLLNSTLDATDDSVEIITKETNTLGSQHSTTSLPNTVNEILKETAVTSSTEKMTHMKIELLREETSTVAPISAANPLSNTMEKAEISDSKNSATITETIAAAVDKADDDNNINAIVTTTNASPLYKESSSVSTLASVSSQEQKSVTEEATKLPHSDIKKTSTLAAASDVATTTTITPPPSKTTMENMALPENNHTGNANYMPIAITKSATTESNNNETISTSTAAINEDDDVAATATTTLEHLLLSSQTETTKILSTLEASKVNTTSAAATVENTTIRNHILANEKENTDSSTIEPTIIQQTTAVPTILATTNTKTPTTETGQIGNEVDLDGNNEHGILHSSSTIRTHLEVTNESTTTKTTSSTNELLITTEETTKFIEETTPIQELATALQNKTEITASTTATTITTTTQASISASTTGSIDLAENPTTTTVTPSSKFEVKVIDNNTITTTTPETNAAINGATVTTTTTPTTTTSAEHENSLETNVIDSIDSTKKPATTEDTDKKHKTEKTPTTNKENQSNSLSEEEEHNVDTVSPAVDTTTSMATILPINAINTTTTTTTSAATTTTTTEPPLISLLDDSSTSTTTTTKTLFTSSTTATHIDETYAVYVSTTTTTEATIANTTSTHSYLDTTSSTPIPTTITTTATTMLPPPLITTEQAASIDSSLPVAAAPTNNIPIMHSNANSGGKETDVNVIIAISVSVIGVIALILLVAFLYLIRKRQKQMSYGQRCRPVSLDAYSLDNVSVLGSVRRKGAARASKRSYGNIGFDDPSLRHNVLSASELGKFIERRTTIFEEFRDVPQIIARADEVPQGCEDKNRYANVIPLPETRVILQQQNNDEKTEYINANYVRGPKDAPNYYIGCQAPLESTVCDFWRMIWEQQSRVIIQATDLNENGIEKCAEYLPPSVTLDNHTTYGDFQVTLKHREVKDKYAISTILLKNTLTESSRELTHYWYKWPEAGVPNEEAPIIAMLLEARSSLKSYALEQSNELKENSSIVILKAEDSSVVDGNATTTTPTSPDKKIDNGNAEINGNVSMEKMKNASKNQGPLTIHCSPGTGRTGTIIACDMAIRSLETTKRSVDVPQIVYYVRRGRASAVQTKEQYEFIYKVANMYATKITNLSNDN